MGLKKVEQSISGDGNYQADGNITVNNYKYASEEEKVSRGIIDEIFELVISKEGNNTHIEKALPEKLLKAEKKIKRNFKKTNEINEVSTYFKYAYSKVYLIEEAYKNIGIERGTDVQNNIHSHIFGVYKDLQNAHSNNLDILKALFKFFTPEGKAKDPLYDNIAKGFVLFFFDDCTIFEKTREEKNIQTVLKI